MKTKKIEICIKYMNQFDLGLKPSMDAWAELYAIEAYVKKLEALLVKSSDALRGGPADDTDLIHAIDATLEKE